MFIKHHFGVIPMATDEFDVATGELLPESFDDFPVKHFVPFLRSAYNYLRDDVSFDTGLSCDDESLAQQHMAEDADINVIVKRFGLTGQLPQGHRMPEFGDFTGVSDYRAALAAVQEAEESFMELPADLRARFQNDPQQYLEFASNPANKEEFYELGLAERPQPAPTPPVDDSKGGTVA